VAGTRRCLIGSRLEGKRVAILVTDGFEQVELTEPREALQREGARTDVVSPAQHWVKGWNLKDWGERFRVDRSLETARPQEYDALLLPGGVMNPDRLRRNYRALAFVRSFFDSRKPVAAICHGPWTLIDAGVARGRRLTSYESLQTDLKNAGAQWIDRAVVVDDGLVTSRKPSDLPAFIEKMIDQFGDERQDRAVG
jgi:protease I